MLDYIVSDQDRELIGAEAIVSIAEVLNRQFELPELQVELSLASSEEIQQLNLEYRDLDEPTDVLSFQILSGLQEVQELPKTVSALLGSIIICPEKVETYGETLPQMVEHGLLHLLGFDHNADYAAWLAVERPIVRQLAEVGIHIPEVPEQ